MNAASVCQKFKTSRRREVVGFAHHAEVAGLSDAEADRLLDWAEETVTTKGKRRSTRELRYFRADTATTELYRLDPGRHSPESSEVSDKPLRIVHAKPPGERSWMPGAQSPARPAPEAPQPVVARFLTSPVALDAFRALIVLWRLPSDRAWRMLTGLDCQASSLSPDQVTHVVQLLAINATMRRMALGSVGEWMVTPNPAPLLAGASPMDYLTRCGGHGYAALLRQVRQVRQVRQWAELS